MKTLSKQWAGALPCALVLLASSARAGDPTTADCLVASNSALDLRNEHKLRAARAQLLVCAAASCPGDIRKECLRRVEDVNAQIPTMLFEAKDGSGRDLSEVRVTMDGVVLAERLEGSALSIDPGEHTFTFEMAGQPPVRSQFVIMEGQKDRRERIVLGPPASSPEPAEIQRKAAPPTVTSATAAVEAPPANPRSSEAEGGLGTQKILALVAGGVGVVGLGVGSAFGLVTLSKRNDAQKACPDLCPDSNGVKLWNDATSAGNVSTAFFVVGAVGIAGAAALWLTAPSKSVQVGLSPGGVQARGTW